MTKDLSPEERLLRLIKGTHKRSEPPEGKPEAQEAVNEPQKEIPQKERPRSEKTFAFVKELLSKESKLDLFKVAVFFLAGFFIIGVAYFSYELFGRRQQPAIIDIDKLIPAETEPIEQEQKQQPKKEQIAKEEEEVQAGEEEFPSEIRELFGAPATRETQSIEEGPTLSELAKDLVLVGVITGDNPQAIIQDRGTRQTFYVYEGENISQLKVKRIEKATVILELNGETLKLSL